MQPAAASERSRERVEDVLADLRERFDEVSVGSKEWTVDAETYADYVDRVACGTLGGAGT